MPDQVHILTALSKFVVLNAKARLNLNYNTINYTKSDKTAAKSVCSVYMYMYWDTEH